jgi:hypothetical protein
VLFCFVKNVAWSLAFEVFEAVGFIDSVGIYTTNPARPQSPHKKGSHTGSTILSPFRWLLAKLPENVRFNVNQPNRQTHFRALGWATAWA